MEKGKNMTVTFVWQFDVAQVSHIDVTERGDLPAMCKSKKYESKQRALVCNEKLGPIGVAKLISQEDMPSVLPRLKASTQAWGQKARAHTK